MYFLRYTAIALFFLSFAYLGKLEASTCENLFGKPSFFSSVLNKYRDTVIISLPKLGRASYRGNEYDISLIGSSKNSKKSAAQILKEVQEIADQLMLVSKRLGVKPSQKIHFVVELSENAVGTNDGKMGAINVENPGPFHAPEGIGLVIPGFHGKRRLYSEPKSRVIFTPYFLDGPLIHRFALAHEFGHALFKTSSTMVNEALADYFAFVATAQTDITFSTMISFLSYNKDGTEVRKIGRGIRDIANPRVKHALEVLPNDGAYHENSTLISNVLMYLHGRLGPDAVINLIQYLDNNSHRLISLDVRYSKETEKELDKQLIDLLERSILLDIEGDKNSIWKRFLDNLFSKQSGNGFSDGALDLLNEARNFKTGEFIEVQYGNVEQTRAALIESYKVIGKLITEWAENELPLNDQRLVNDLLKSRGLTPN